MTTVNILGVETSCDETAAAVVEGGRHVRSSIVASQIAQHAPFGGVVPEVACRAHAEQVLPVIDQALREAGTDLDSIDAIAVTNRPGLVGALLVGVQAAKGIAYARGLPLVGVDHIQGHLYANQLGRDDLESPSLHLVVSGAHSHIFLSREPGVFECLGRTIDDAAGEALDKISILMGLGYPGGPAIERAATGGDPTAFAFPRALVRKDNHDFSFSGFKTAVRVKVQKLTAGGRVLTDEDVRNLAASAQEAIVDVLTRKTFRLARTHAVRAVALTGGVAANASLRQRFTDHAQELGVPFYVPDRSYCTDNAAMIAGLGGVMFSQGMVSDWNLDADPTRS